MLAHVGCVHDGSMDTIIANTGNQALRRGRASVAAPLYLVTTVTLGRKILFADPLLACATARATLDSRIWRTSRLHCWVLMPDHWHAVLEVGDDDSLARVMARFKSSTAREVNVARGGGDRVWQRAYHDHAMRRDEDLLSIARYVISNPRRAGLVASVGDYPYWNAAWL